MYHIEFNEATQLYDLTENKSDSDSPVAYYAGIPSKDVAEKLAHGLSHGDTVPFSQDIADLARQYAVGDYYAGVTRDGDTPKGVIADPPSDIDGDEDAKK